LFTILKTKQSPIPTLSNRPSVLVQSVDQCEAIIRDFKEEGAFTKLHPLDEIGSVDKEHDSENQSLNNLTPSVDGRITDGMDRSHVKLDCEDILRSPINDDSNNATSPEELLTSYIESSEVLDFDYDQEFSLGSDIGNSFSSLNSTPARDAITGDERSSDHGKMLHNKDSDYTYFHLHQSSGYQTFDTGHERRMSVSSNEQENDFNDDHGINGVKPFKERSYSNDNRDVEYSEENTTENALLDTERNRYLLVEDMGRNIMQHIGQEKSDRLYEKAITDPSPSSAMRVAQELLRKNRLKRQLQSTKSDEIDSIAEKISVSNLRSSSEDESDPQSCLHPVENPYAHDYDQTETQSDTSRSDKNSRRALILQLAKSRIKSQKALSEKSLVS